MRNQPHVWKSFRSLKVGEWFFLGKRMHEKKNCVRARPSMEEGTVFVVPWKRVKTMQLVKGSKSHPIPGTMAGRVNSGVRYFPGNTHPGSIISADILNAMAQSGCNGPQRTHFVGDDCPGGHHAENQTETKQSMDIDHTPEKPPEHERTGPLS